MDGNAPSWPVTAATRIPATNAGRIGGILGARNRCVNRYASSAAPTINGTSSGSSFPRSEVLRAVNTFTTNGSTTPAISPCTICGGIQAPIRSVTPSSASGRRIAPATIAAPASSGKVSRSPSVTKKMIAKMFPVSSNGCR